MSVVVVGAGIIGLSSAVAIQNLKSRPKVTIISDKFSPDTTGDGAAGLWGPYLLGDTPPEKVAKWSGDTHKYFHEMWKQDIGGIVGISMIPCIRVVNDANATDPEWKDVVYGYRRLSAEEISKYPIPELKFGNEFVTYICEAAKLLPYLLETFKQNGGTVIKGTVKSLDELCDRFNIVVNCTGVYAAELTPDSSVKPKRGQVLRVSVTKPFQVRAPEQNQVFLDDSDDGRYIIPNQDTVVLGGTHQDDDWNLNADPADTKFIQDGCYRIYPSLKHAEIIKDWVGLRPGRPSVRLEAEYRKSHGQQSYMVVHNYGHGGSGITLSWGCALETASLVEDGMNRLAKSTQSKL